jgi:hypothetical protein
MDNKSIENVSRVLPFMVADGEEKVAINLTWSLPGNLYEIDEPELTVVEVKATALSEEICVRLVVEQTTYYTMEEAGVVEKAITIHRLTEMLPAANVRPGQWVSIDVVATMQGAWQRTNDKVRGMDATLLRGECVLDLRYTVVEEKEIHFSKPVGLDGEIMAETVGVESVCTRFEETIDLALYAELADIPKSVGALEGSLINVKATPMCGWIKVEGEVTADVSYLADDEMAKGEKFVFPLREFIEVPDAAADMDAELLCRVELVTCRLEHGEKIGLLRGLLYLEGRLSFVEPLAVPFMARSHQSFIHHQPHHKPPQHLLEEVIGTGSSQTLIQREIIFSRPVRKVREPVDAQLRNLQHEIIPNKVIVRGVLHKQIFAVDADTGTVFAQDVTEPFVHFVDVPGASPGMRAHVKARVEFVKVDIHPGGESARQVTIIEITVKVTRVVKKDFILSPISPVLPIHPKPIKPTEKIYIVRSGDSIWKIANMFGVSMEAIIRANNLANPNLIFPGQQLIIPR